MTWLDVAAALRRQQPPPRAPTSNSAGDAQPAKLARGRAQAGRERRVGASRLRSTRYRQRL